MRKLLFILFLMGLEFIVSAQDPHFTQFYSAPFTVNPAYAGVFEGKIRLATNYRQQWGNLADPYVTSSVSVDTKIGSNPKTGQNPFNIGMHFMNDNSMQGAFRSSYFGLVASYHVNLDEDGYNTLGAGLSGNFGNRKIDFSSISFDQQFTSDGFNLSLPNGEAALQAMKPFFSVGAGVLYRYDNSETGDFVELGLSGYHFNKPKQSVLNDPNEYLPVRYSAQATYQKYLNETSILKFLALYQRQAEVKYLLGGFSFSKLFGSTNDMQIGIGSWYRTGDAVSPYVFMGYKKFRLGMTYDVTTSNLSKGLKPAKSYEFSMQWRFEE